MTNHFAGSRGGLTPKDEEMMRDIFFLDRVPFPQLARLHYPGIKSRRPYNRLNQLQNKKNLLTNEVFYVDDADDEGRPKTATLNFFSLTLKARQAIGDALAAEGLPPDKLFARLDESPPDDPLPQGKNGPDSEELKRLGPLLAEHFARVTALYVALKGALQRELGHPGTGWLWRNERRSYRPFTRSEGQRHYRPDAELLLTPLTSGRSLHLFIEMQTASSHATSDEIAKKVADYSLATTRHLFPKPQDRLLLFAGETKAHIDAATLAGTRYNVPLISGSPNVIVSRVQEFAARLARGEAPGLPQESHQEAQGYTSGAPRFGPSYRAAG